MNNTNMLKPALIGGMAMGILSAIPGLSACNCVCCAWAICGGIFAAYLYVKDSLFPITMGRGAGVGLVSGAIGGTVGFLFSIPIQRILTGGGNPMMAMEQFKELMEKNPDFPEEARRSIEALLAHDYFTIFVAIFGFLSNVAGFSIFAMLGGAIGVALFEKRKPGTNRQDTPPPPVEMPPPDNF